MPKPQCANCGANMIETYTKDGFKVYFCKNVPYTRTKTTVGKPHRAAYVYCMHDIKGLKSAFEIYTEDVKGLTIQTLRKATCETIADAKLYENANLAIMLGLPKSQLAELFEAAYKLSLSIGLAPDRGIHALCKGVGRRSRLLLDNIGITFKPSDAYDWYKRMNAQESLTTDEKTEAWRAYAIFQIKEKAREIDQKPRGV